MSTSEHDTYAELARPPKRHSVDSQARADRISFWAAMHSVQRAVRAVKRDSKNPHFRSSYASLETVIGTLRDAYLDAGLVVMQEAHGAKDGIVMVRTLIADSQTGYEHPVSTFVPIPKNDPQGAGSATTYACRYALMAAFMLPPTDDDGEAARAPERPSAAADAPPRLSPDGEPVPTLEEALRDCDGSILEIKAAFQRGDESYALQCWDELGNAHKQALWVAPSKYPNAPFTTKEREALKRLKAEASVKLRHAEEMSNAPV